MVRQNGPVKIAGVNVYGFNKKTRIACNVCVINSLNNGHKQFALWVLNKRGICLLVHRSRKHIFQLAISRTSLRNVAQNHNTIT